MFWLRDAIDQVFYPAARDARRAHIKKVVDEKYHLLDKSIRRLDAVSSWSLRNSQLLVDTMTQNGCGEHDTI